MNNCEYDGPGWIWATLIFIMLWSSCITIDRIEMKLDRYIKTTGEYDG